MIKKFKALDKIMQIYVITLIGLCLQSIRSVAQLAGAGDLVSLILSGSALITFGYALVLVLRKN